MALVAGAKEPEKKADYLANKKKHIESRGNSYDAQQWSDHFESLDTNKDGLLSAEEKAAYKEAKKLQTIRQRRRPKKIQNRGRLHSLPLS